MGKVKCSYTNLHNYVGQNMLYSYADTLDRKLVKNKLWRVVIR